ncbi:hypothetical protein ITP53_38015 [Nonomuraea sp. K274]|uniref:Uncharacterized protein n=1 Tax=Nonomuraea cypriaca TaxID=1187855 RepID=A0A931AJ91_9ACTN|nr:hypothetical protein [Nonomuraea cypriaca]MBF8191399.1 hypothetical protein [Nonomuraea cypriaca]
MEQPGRDDRGGPRHLSCTPLPAVQLYEITVLDPASESGPGHWHTIGWGVDRMDADSIAETYVSRATNPYDAVQVRQNGLLVSEHRRPAG